MFEEISVVGMHFRGAWAKEYCAALQGGEILRLEREPDNAYDAFAIKVLTPGGQHLGYIEGSKASFIAVEIDEGGDWVAEVTSTEVRKNNIHPIVTVRPADETELNDDEDFDDGAD